MAHLNPAPARRDVVWSRSGPEPDGRDTRRQTCQTIPRDALIRRLTEVGDDVCLILLEAPVGYGKTSAVSNWTTRSSGAVAWVTVTPDLRSRTALVEMLLHALPGSRSSGELLVATSASGEGVPPETAAQRFASTVARAGRSVTIVLDDLHLLRAREALDFVVAAALRLPAGSRIVAMGDRRLRLPLGRLRSGERCWEFGPGDLAFSQQEAEELLRRAGLDLDRQTVHDLVRRTEGWPLGLQLAVRTVRDRPDPSASLAEIDGTTNVIADFFRGEVLAHLSVETVRFLMRTAVLDQMCPSLCDAVLGLSGSAAWLDEVHELGLFVLPEDDRGEWFRYHRLFREMLRGELRHREPGEDLRILREAARWYDDRGAPEEAIGNAVAGHANLLAAQLIVAHGQQINSTGRTRLVTRWLRLLGEDMLGLYPPLAVTAAWFWALAGDAARARHALLLAETASFDGTMPNGSASFAAALGGIRAILAPEGVEGMLADARRVERVKPAGSPGHTRAALTLGVATWFTGSPAEAAGAFERAARFGREEQQPEAAWALAEQALLAADAEDWQGASACARQARSIVDARGLSGHLSALPAYAAAARVALRRGDTQRAWREIRDAMRLYRDPSPRALPWLAVQTACVLGEVFVGLGDIAAAEQRLVEARRHLALLPTKGILPAAVDRLALLVDGGLRREEVESATGLTKAELRVLELLPSYHTLAEIGDELSVSRNTVKTHVAAIYRKLNAVTRAEAVRHAQDVGLLGG